MKSSSGATRSTSKLRNMIDSTQRALVDRVVAGLQADERIVGVAMAGSYATGGMDEYSDLDFVIAVDPDAYDAVLADRMRLVAGFGALLSAFTGEHVHEPRLIICLYADPLLHADFKFVALPDLAKRVDEPVVLWERGGRLSAVLADSGAVYPPVDEQWLEDRFWTWVHYTAAKIGRGELFDALGALDYLRGVVLGPLALQRNGFTPNGVRRLEQRLPEFAARLRGVVAGHDRASIGAALRTAIDLYRELRPPTIDRRSAAEAAACAYADAVLPRG
jgi:predicted nucleotidyltransferase